MKVLSAGPDPNLVLTAESGHDRKPGVHLSDIMKRRMFERDKKYNPENPMDMMVIECGYTWETVLERALSHRHERAGFRPEQILADGVWMSPDWVNPDARDVQHEEWKATKKKCSTDTVGKDAFQEKNWYWLPACMAYLRMLLKLGMARALKTRFRVWHINGDYSYEAKTSDFKLLNDYWTYDVEFTKRELEENWTGLLNDGWKYGLLKTAPGAKRDECQKATQTRRIPSLRKSSGRAPQPSRRAAPVLTFPRMKRSKPLRSAS